MHARNNVIYSWKWKRSRHSPRNKYVANVLQDAGIATLLLDLLTEEEEEIDIQTLNLRFDIDLLAKRLLGATDWLQDKSTTNDLRIGYFGASNRARSFNRRGTK